MYTIDEKKPALFSVMDPMLQRPISIPIVWGIMYTFQITVYSRDKKFLIVHNFNVLEYIDERMYILEHYFHCSGAVDENLTFGRLCRVQNTIVEDSVDIDHLINKPEWECETTVHDDIHAETLDKSTESLLKTDQVTVPECSTGKSGNRESKESSKIKNDDKTVNMVNVKRYFSVMSYNVWNTNVFGDYGNLHHRYAERIQRVASVSCHHGYRKQ